MNICEHLTTSAKRFPDKVAIAFEGHSFTYGQLDELSGKAALLLSEGGVNRGDRVAISLPNVPAFVIWYYASLRIGAIAVSISTRLTEKEVAFLVSDCEATAFIAEAMTLSRHMEHLPACVARTFGVSRLSDRCNGKELERAPVAETFEWSDAKPDEAALILYTSGTTGFAKGATLSHNNVRSNVLEFNRLCDMRPDDRILLALPLFHCFGQNALLNSALNAGATIVLQCGFDLNESIRLIREQVVTQLYGVPTMFQLLKESCNPEDLSSVRYCFSAAAKLPVQVSNSWQKKFGKPIYEGYGLTETSPFASYNHHKQYVMGSIGTPIDQVEMKIVDIETGEKCPPGELGEIAIRGPNIMLGYWNGRDETAEAIRDGWFHSGDIGRVDERGYFYIVDRIKDMMVVGGLKVYPAEVERILLDHQGVSQAAVVGLPEDVFGEQVVAFVVMSTEASADFDALLRHCRDNLASYKVPKHFVPLEELPRNPSGKILKTKLREYDLGVMQSTNAAFADELAVHLPAHSSAKRDPTLWSDFRRSYATNRLRLATEFVQGLIQSLTGEEHRLEPDTRFLEVGLDSLMIVEMSSRIQAEIGSRCDIPVTLLFDCPRICDLAEFLIQTYETHEEPSAQIIDTARHTVSAPAHGFGKMRQEIIAMSEDEALDELMRELESS